MFTYSISMVLQESVAGMGDTDRVIQFAEECLIRGQEERPELVLSLIHISRNIADPWYTGDFETTYRDIVEGCEAFLRYLEREK